MTNHDKFTEADIRGRQIFKEYANKQPWYTFKKESKNIFAHWDISYVSGSTQVIGEIKMRDCKSTSFTDFILEIEKLEYLKQVQSEVKSKTQLQYINIFNDGVVMIWTLDELNLTQVKEMLLNKKKMGDNRVINKNVIMLRTCEAVLIDSLK